MIVTFTSGVKNTGQSIENTESKENTNLTNPTYTQQCHDDDGLPPPVSSRARIHCCGDAPAYKESASPGDFANLKSYLPSGAPAVTGPLDLRTDCPRFNVYHNGQLTRAGVPDIKEEWTPDHVAFLIGCSYSFESALASSGLAPRHIVLGRNVSIYRSSIKLNPAGVFEGGTLVVSMRPYPKAEIKRVRDITRGYLATHGEPVAWGWDALKDLGIEDIDKPEWGDAPLTLDGRALGDVAGDEDNVPVFWGNGVTSQEAVGRAALEGTVMAHAPGFMLLLDAVEDDILVKGRA